MFQTCGASVPLYAGGHPESKQGPRFLFYLINFTTKSDVTLLVKQAATVLVRLPSDIHHVRVREAQNSFSEKQTVEKKNEQHLLMRRNPSHHFDDIFQPLKTSALVALQSSVESLDAAHHADQ